MKRIIKIKPEGIMKLHEAKRYVSAPDPEAEAYEYQLNLFYDLIDRGILPPDASFERFRKELHDFDHGYRRKQTQTRYAAKDEKPPQDLDKPLKPRPKSNIYKLPLHDKWWLIKPESEPEEEI
jgi:hypothetical protein